ncbi:MAG TPA: DSD1 family PLP-dependent enzyme [Bryobacteraceae bacterium]|jgi:D-serine deaminase-like pyridoxal phosphate-dependent protein|nr:DSD1 family PLP-dependent enzyme [Bryobacteraceae bacterium]
MWTRRACLTALVSAPAVLRGAKSYTFEEIERFLQRGDLSKVSRHDLPTPALILELDAFEANVQKMASHAKQSGRALRPHGKTHKCPEIAKRLIRAGAVGCCAAKVSEAEAFAADGVTGLLITSAMVGQGRIERAVRLAKSRPDTIFCVDNVQNAEDLDAAARTARLKMRVAIDLLVGRRTGITPGEPAVALAKRIDALKNLEFVGLQAYAGHASHTKGFENRKKVSEEAMGLAVETRRAIEKSGVRCDWLSGASTGTYNIDSNIEGVTELQPGSFMFMDVDYSVIGGTSGEKYRDFATSLFVITTVISKPSDSNAIVDGGFKTFATDRPFGPQLRDRDDIPYAWAGDEHGNLNLSKADRPVKLGDRLEFVVPHCDPTVNLHDQLFALRGDKVEGVWKIAARGKLQ